MEEAKSLLEIIKEFLCEKECIVKNDIDENKLYQLAKINSVSNFLQKWAHKNAKSQEIKNQINKDYTAQIVRDTNQRIEIENILNTFEENNIKTLVVKGAIIKDIYPQNYMREMCDIDILVDDKHFKKAIKLMKDMGFHKFFDEEKHLIFTKGPLIVIEMHRKLILEKDVGYEYFNNIWPLCVTYKDYNYIYQLDKENAYIFCMLHLLIHFKFTGIKIKDMLDVYLYHENYKNILNYDKLDDILINLGIKQFEQNIKNIAYAWFGTNEINDFNDMEKFILNGSRVNNRVTYSIGKSHGKIRFLVNLLFPEMSVMKKKYTILEKLPVLLPFMWLIRIFGDIFSTRISLKTRWNTIKLIKEADEKEIQKVKDIYDKLGIK